MRQVLRQAHRWLAVAVGFQLLAWVVGGVYFSWTKLSNIRGEHLLHPSKPVPIEALSWSRLAQAISALSGQGALEKLESFYLLGKPAVRVRLKTKDQTRILLLTADGRPIPPLDRTQAQELAKQAFLPKAQICAVAYLTELPAGHEYRNRPLPVYAVTFDYPGRPTVYVAAESGEVTAIRHDGWRVFDFLWMLHTLDFKGRDDINNSWLRIASIAALITLFSGYLLFAMSCRRPRCKPASSPKP